MSPPSNNNLLLSRKRHWKDRAKLAAKEPSKTSSCSNTTTSSRGNEKVSSEKDQRPTTTIHDCRMGTTASPLSRYTTGTTGSMRKRLSSLLVGVLSLQAAAALDASEERRLHRDRRLQAAQIIEEKYQYTDRLDLIVSFATSSGNVDYEVGSKNFQRTNAKAMRGVTRSFYNSLRDSEEVIVIEYDAPMEAAATTVVDGNEQVPWGADLILQSAWDEIPDPTETFPICIVDSGLLVEHQDIVSERK